MNSAKFWKNIECGCGRNGWEKWNNGCGEKKKGDRPEEPSQQQKTHETHDKRRDRYLRYDNSTLK